MRALLVALLVIAWPARAEVQTFEQADWRGSSWNRFPDPSEWTPVSLPHSWYKHQDPRVFGLNGDHRYYRIRFLLREEPFGQSIYIPKARFGQLEVSVNNKLIWSMWDAHRHVSALDALLIPVPPGLLREGDNEIELLTYGHPRWRHGLSRIYLGSTKVLAPRAAMYEFLQAQAAYIIAATFGAIGLICLWLWPRPQRDPVLFWYGVLGVTLVIAAVLTNFAQWRAEFYGWRTGIRFYWTQGYVVALVVLHLRLAGRRHLLLEGMLWIFLVSAMLLMSSYGPGGGGTWSVRSTNTLVTAGAVLTALPAVLAATLLLVPALRVRPGVLLLAIADLAVCLLPLHDWAALMGILEFDRPRLVYYAPAFVMLAAIAPMVERVKSARRAAEQNRLELERRVAEKTREIEASHERLREVQREAALAEERRRIMADMHDGLGARLVALLSVVQSGKAKHGEISEGIASALDELRLAVDSVQPVEGDVGVVLGNVRHRMRSVFERSGVRLAWNVAALPRMENLTPERILAVQRVFLEVLSNAIRHAQAKTVSVFAMRVPGAVRIVIEDDGCGFDVSARHAGTGLANLRTRASQAGGSLEIDSQPGKGTRITLSLPFEGGDSPEPLPNSGEETTHYPLRGMAADPASS